MNRNTLKAAPHEALQVVVNRAREHAMYFNDQVAHRRGPYVQAAAVVADAFLKEQRKAVAARIDSAGDADADMGFLGVKRSWDETPAKLWARDLPHFRQIVAELGLDLSCWMLHDRKHGAAVFQVMQQRAAISTTGDGDASGFEPIYISAKMLQRTSAVNMFSALDIVIPDMSMARLQAATEKYEFVLLLALMCDFVAANQVIQAGMAAAMPDVLVMEGRCSLHQCHICFNTSVKPWKITPAMHSLGGSFSNASSQCKLIKAVGLQSRRVRIHYRAPPPAAASHAAWVTDLTIARFVGLDDHLDPRRAARVRDRITALTTLIRAVLNGRWWLGRCERFWWKPDGSGQPCCSSPNATFKKALQL